ncbi:hypothetical protein BDA99DRAFT_608287 [Phascolomyces articulosus]|uniref:Uncharacterized protein n=1 Tax=Phascolomyces articulosus TaxID=60185 RepID=A0AAD5JS50_9FUNG|nr:hypothetical protein BDA99DRAFT_608287 [Phascolomyces articulosus]
MTEGSRFSARLQKKQQEQQQEDELRRRDRRYHPPHGQHHESYRPALCHYENPQGLVQQQQETLPSIYDTLSSLLDRTLAIEERMSYILDHQRQQGQILESLQQTLGIPDTPKRGHHLSNRNTITQKKSHPPTSSLTTVACSSKSRWMDIPTPSMKEIPSWPLPRIAPNGLPSAFVYRPRTKDGRKLHNPFLNELVDALYSLSTSPKTQALLWKFMDNTAMEGAEMIQKRVPYRERVLPWTFINEKVRKDVEKWVVKIGRNHTPPIPLDQCEGNWLAYTMLMRRWKSVILIEKRKRQYAKRLQSQERRIKSQARKKQEQQQEDDLKKLTRYIIQLSTDQELNISRLKTPIVIPAIEQEEEFNSPGDDAGEGTTHETSSSLYEGKIDSSSYSTSSSKWETCSNNNNKQSKEASTQHTNQQISDDGHPIYQQTPL